MPVLYKYTDRNGYYIRTAIDNKAITFQLTDEGLKKLSDAGIESEQRFDRALLLDLYRTGLAYTHGTGPGVIAQQVGAGQLVFDFPNDPEPASMFPACSQCKSLNDLHLVEIREKEPYASLLCANCREKKAATIDTSIPLSFVSKGILERILTMKEIKKADNSVGAYKELLDAELASRWEALIKSKTKPEQQALLHIDAGKQKTLL